MPITALPTPPTRSDPTNFAARGDAFLAALPTFQAEANALAVAMNLNSTTDASTSSVLIGTGAKTFAVTAGKSFQPGMYLVIADTAAPSTNSMWGQVTSYSGTALVMAIIAVRGSGTKADWVVSQSAAGNAAAGANADITSLAGLTTALSIAQGGTGAATANAAADALGAYRKGTLLGAVAQAAGVPTGAVIETGGNGNGTYAKWADGTQMCWGTIDIPSHAISTQVDATKPWAAAFFAVPAVHISVSREVGDGSAAKAGLLAYNGVTTGTSTAAACNVQTYSYRAAMNNGANVIRLNTLGIGRWF